MKTIGDNAADFSLSDTAGRTVSLSALLETGPTLLVFVEADCPTSRLTVERLAALETPFAAAGAQVVSVHQDSAEIAARTMRRCHASYTALVEPAPFATADAYGVATVPTAFLVGADGAIIDTVEGWSSADFNRIAATVARAAGCAAGTVTGDHPVEKPGCSSKNTLDPSLLAGFEQSDFDEMEDMFERGWTDGLPVVPPTRERVDRMLAGRDPSLSLGPVPPGMGELTLERLAALAVLAGCHPSYFPLVRAAAEATLDPAFNAHGLTNTTHTCGPVLIVNGPVRHRIGMNSGINAMGGWNRANVTVGRAIRLMLGLTGRGTPGTLDRSTLGQPGKISFCFAENEEVSPWESLAVSRGFEPDQSVVTLYCGDCPLSVSDHYTPRTEDVILSISLAGAAAFSPHLYPMAAETVFVISPEHVNSFAERGWSKAEVAERIFEASRCKVSALRGGEQGPFTAALDGDVELTKWASVEEVVLVVAGGPAGRFSAVLPPWVGFGLGSAMVSRAVEEDA